MDKVSIIIPVYNTPKKYLEGCIKSVTRQTYKEIEIVIIDDGSKDEVANLLDKYAKEYQNIKVIHKVNEGVSTARNIGIKNSTGNWVVFVDSDDYVENNAIEKMINNSENADIVISRTQMTTQDKASGYDEKIRINKSNKIELIKGLLSTKDSKFFFVDGLWSKMYSSKLLKNMDIMFKADLPFGEDFIFNMSAYLSAKNIMYIPDVLYHWVRENEESVTRKYNPKLSEKQIKVIEYINKEFKESILKEYKQLYFEYVAKILLGIIRMQIYHSENKDGTSQKRETVKTIVKNKYFEECIQKVELNRLHKDRKLLIIILRNKMYYLIHPYVLLKIIKEKINKLKKCIKK